MRAVGPSVGILLLSTGLALGGLGLLTGWWLRAALVPEARWATAPRPHSLLLTTVPDVLAVCMVLASDGTLVSAACPEDLAARAAAEPGARWITQTGPLCHPQDAPLHLAGGTP